VRAIARGLPAEAARTRLEAQGTGAKRRAAADRILDSSGDLAELRRQVDDLVIELDRLAADRARLHPARP
jgi:dephospho-CoA kinase